MRFATILEDGQPTTAIVRDGRVAILELPHGWRPAIRELAALGPDEFEAVRTWADEQPVDAFRSLDEVQLGPAVPDPGAIYTIGLNYPPPGTGPDDPDPERPERPLVYGKLPTSVTGHGAVVSWDRSLTPNVDAEVELGVVIGAAATDIEPADAMRHVFGYTCVNDMSSRDPWLDGDQWLLGKSFAGFCPVGPWVVTADEIARPGALRLGCAVNDVAIQDGRTDAMRFPIAEIVAFLSRHVTLRPGDLIATGTPPRLAAPRGPEARLAPGDEVTVWIEDIGELTTSIA